MEGFEHSLALSELQYKNLMKGKTVQLTNFQLNNGGVPIRLFKHNYLKIEKAKRNSSGVRIQLEPHEIAMNQEMHGGNLMHKLDKVGNKILKGLRTVGKSGFLQPLMTYGLASAGVDPLGATLASSIATTAVNKGKTVKPAINLPLPKPTAPPAPPVNPQQGSGLMMSTRAAGKGLMMSTGIGKGLVMSTGRGINKKTIIL